jgi:parallel beta helix pectate lyase-like protein
MRRIVTLILVVLGSTLLAYGTTITVSPGSADDVTRAIGRAQPGDVIELRSGTYSGTIEVRRSGRPEQAIIITAASGASVTIDGGVDPRVNPTFSGEDWGETSGTPLDNQGIRIIDSDWIVIRGLRFVNCWTDAIRIQRSSYITIQDCNMDKCGQHAVSCLDFSSHHILIEGCRWTQDRRTWTEWDWLEMHHRSLWHFCGGLIGVRWGSDTIVRRNHVSYVYNGLTWSPENSKGEGQSNIEVYENVFEYCRDNIIEPEGYVFNMHVYHNVLNSCPRGTFSIDRVNGGDLWIYGNTSRYDENDCADDFWWTMFKFYKDFTSQGYLNLPLRIYNNSWETGPVFGDVKRGEDHVYHVNNAMSFVTGDFGRPAAHGIDWICDYDISSVPWSSQVTSKGFEMYGIVGDPLFKNVARDDFRLQPGSPGIDAGTIIDGFTQFYMGSAPDIGAYEDDLLVYGRPFIHIDPPGQRSHSERPRIVRCFARGDRLAIFFSANLVPGTIGPSDIYLSVRGMPITIEQVVYPGNQRIMTLTLDRQINNESQLSLEFVNLPRGANGQAGTMWGANLIVAGIPEKAILLDEMALAFADDVMPSPAPAAPKPPSTTNPPGRDF